MRNIQSQVWFHHCSCVKASMSKPSHIFTFVREHSGIPDLFYLLSTKGVFKAYDLYHCKFTRTLYLLE